MSGSVDLATATARRAAARAQFLGTLDEAKARLNPATLAQQAVDNVKDNVVRNTVDTVKAKPGMVAMVAGAAALFFARKPIARMMRSDEAEATATDAASLKSDEHKRQKDRAHD